MCVPTTLPKIIRPFTRNTLIFTLAELHAVSRFIKAPQFYTDLGLKNPPVNGKLQGLFKA